MTDVPSRSGSRSRSTFSSKGRTSNSAANRSSRSSRSTGSKGVTDRAPGNRSDGFTGFQSRSSNRTYKDAKSYRVGKNGRRSDLNRTGTGAKKLNRSDRDLSRQGRNRTNAGSAANTARGKNGRSGARDANANANRSRSARGNVGNRAGANRNGVNRNGANRVNRSALSGGFRRGGANRLNRGIGINLRGRGNYRHNAGRFHRHFNDFYFGIGGYGFGFGYYRGFGYYNNTYGLSPWWNWGYSSSYCLPYYYPQYRGFCYPYYWSYRYYPRYRTYATNYASYREPYVSSVYLPVDGFDDDPFVTEEWVADPVAGSSESSEEPGPAVVPIVDGVNAGSSFDEAAALGDKLIREGKTKEAAEAYRQAWIQDGTRDGLGRMSAALLAAGDYPLAAWAMVGQIQGQQKNLLDQGLLMHQLLGGPGLTKSTENLERYLLDNPNDEGSNLLLASLYVFSGREFSGYMILGRLDVAEYEPATTKLFLERAKTSLSEK